MENKMPTKQEEKNIIQRIMSFLVGLLEEEDEEDDSHERDATLSTIYYAVEAELATLGYEYPWIINYMHGSSESYMVFQAGGKLYRANFSVNADDTVVVNEEDVLEVKLDYPVIEQNRMKPVVRTLRGANGELLFLAIAASTVLNRVGQIDSTELFDDFEVEFASRDTPYVTLQHLPKALASFGTVKGIFRLNSLLMAYGEIDETTVLGRAAEERFKTGEWGISIGFQPTDVPVMEEIGGVEIPVFNHGYLVEVSVLKEDRAASYFTAISSVDREIRRMSVNTEVAKKLMLEFAGEAAEEDVDELLEEANAKQRAIEDDGLITREIDGDKNNNANEELVESDSEEENEDDTPTEDESVESSDLVIDSDVLEQLTELVAARVTETVNETIATVARIETEVREQLRQINEFVTRVNVYMKENDEHNEKQEKRLIKVEEKEGVKVREALEDVPAQNIRRVVVNHRPTKPDDEGAKEPVSGLSEIANQTLDDVGVDTDKF